VANETFLSKLQAGPVLFDGAMGTMLYEKGTYINQCYEALNLSASNIVQGIHKEYLQAGCDVIETNTFGANAFKLKQFALEKQVVEINQKAVDLARAAGQGHLVAGAMGPIGAYLKPLGPIEPKQAKPWFEEQIKALVDRGVDVLVFETFADINELQLAVKCARGITELPIMVQASFNDRGETLIGTNVKEYLRQANEWPIQALGFNCSTGPADMLTLVEKAVHITQKPISCQPNAGLPRLVDGRYFYLASPEYLAEYAKRFIQAGARIVGGCCGTTPAHTKAMRSALRALFPKQGIQTTTRSNTAMVTCAEMPLEHKSNWGKKLSQKQFVTTVEITPPKGADPKGTLEKCQQLKTAGVDAVNIPDGPRASARLSPLVLAMLIEREIGLEAVLHYTCRDRNIIGMQSDLLGAFAGGIRNLLIITGDPPKLGDYPDATAVFDVDSIGLTRIVTRLNQCQDVGGNPITAPLGFVKGVGVNPGAIDMKSELDRLQQKLDAGAEFIITQPVFDVEIFMRFHDQLADLKIPLIAGVWPLISFKNAEFMNNEVPGAHVPDSLMERMHSKGSGPDAQAEGITIAGEAIRDVRSRVAGVQVSAPLGKVDIALAVLRAGKVL
jgi:methionine synthase / methylenetetrahydrofolate reductase(NADPH)